MDEDLDASEGAKIFKALHEARLPPLSRIEHPVDDDSSKKPVALNWLASNKRQRPTTKLQALMEAAPHEEPEISYQEIHEEREELTQAVENVWAILTDTERWIYHMLVDVGLSMRFVALALGTPKTTFARRRDELAQKIKTELLRYPAVIAHLTKDLQYPPDGTGIDLET